MNALSIKQLNCTMLLGACPLLLLIAAEYTPVQPPPWMAQSYTAIVLTFIAGLNWYHGCEQNNRHVLLWSVLLSILSWLLIIVSVLWSQSILIWISLLFLINLSYRIDDQLYRSKPNLRALRKTGTWALNSLISIALLMTLITKHP